MSQELSQFEDDGFVGMWDRRNPRSIWNRVPPKMQEAMDAIPDKVRFQGEGFLYRKAKPSKNVQDARQRFWELFRLHDTRRISMTQAFNNNIAAYYEMLKKPHRLMWFLNPPADLISGQKSMLERTMNLVRDALKEENLYITKRKITRDADGNEVIDETRELNTKAMAEVRKLMGDMTDRVHGTAIQRIAHAHTISPLQQMDAGQILEAAEADVDTPMPELHDSLQNDRAKDVPIEKIIEADLEDLFDGS